jgi:hypothetical protein
MTLAMAMACIADESCAWQNKMVDSTDCNSSRINRHVVPFSRIVVSMLLSLLRKSILVKLHDGSLHHVVKEQSTHLSVTERRIDQLTFVSCCVFDSH